jgi:protein phosphatase
MRNEDFTYVDAERGFAIVADGMGGLQAGQIASRTAVETASFVLEEAPHFSLGLLEDALRRAHDAVQNKADDLGLLGQMGTTLVIWAANDGGCVVSHIGDSRAYHSNDAEFVQLTKDQTLAQRMIDLGLSEPDDEMNERNAHVLTQAVGLPGDFEPQSISLGVNSGTFLLCSDGLTDMVVDDRIQELITSHDIDVCADELVKAALDRGGRDNVSVVLIEG